MDYAYLDRVLKEKKNEFDGKVTYAWLQFDDQKSANEAGGMIEASIRDIKCETSSSAYSRFMAPLKDILRDALPVCLGFAAGGLLALLNQGYLVAAAWSTSHLSQSLPPSATSPSVASALKDVP